MSFLTEIVPLLLTLGLCALVWVRNEQRWREWKSEARKEMDRMWEHVQRTRETTAIRIVPGKPKNGIAT